MFFSVSPASDLADASTDAFAPGAVESPFTVNATSPRTAWKGCENARVS